ncbi:MAG: elongation factor G [Bacteroidales bacterium]|nr:elongation factor G [Bacteroidales bacterium]
MKIYQPFEVKNIALIGGAKSGKTTLGEAMVFNGGGLNRRGSVEEGNTLSDYREIELERRNSIFSTVLFTEYAGKKINIIDAPGFDDFIGEVVASLKVADSAVMMINAQNGVEVGTEIIWRYTVKDHTPLLFVVNQLEHDKANFEETINQLKSQFGEKVTLVQYPINAGIGFNTIIDVYKMKMLKYPKGGGKPEILPIPDSEKNKAEELQMKLIEAAAESEESLMEIFFENGTLTEEEMVNGIKKGIVNRDFFPLFCASAKENIGITELLDFVASVCPSAIDVPFPKTTNGKELNFDINQPACAFVYKTSIEQHLGEVSFFKIMSGQITEGMDMINSVTNSKERISQLFAVCGKNRTKIEKAFAGDIVATVKLRDTYTNNTLTTAKFSDDIVEPIVYPEPKFRTAIKSKNTSDDEKLGTVLKRLRSIDPTIIIEHSIELKQILVHGQGELHLNILKWQVENLDKIEIEFITPKIPYRETITKPAKSMYRHKKQSGGAGQFGEVHMMIEPYIEGKPDQTEFPIRGRDEIKLTWGGKLMYHNCIVGGAIDARFHPAIIKGIMEKIEEGPLTGSYARDIIVSVYDGKMHPVDSNEISFKLAGRNAFKEAFKNAGPKILEPIYDVEVIVPEDRMGDVITDLQGRRGIMMGMESEGNYQKIKARVPLAEMNKYSTSLSSITSGRATYSLRFAEYQQVPADVQDTLIKTYEAQEQDED